VETAIVLPVFLFVLWGIIWAVQASVINERVQMAVRYSGLVSNESAPFVDYSLYALYNNLVGIASPPAFSCQAPNTDALTNSNTYPGPTTFSMWTPGTTSGTCSQAETSLQGTGLIQPQIFTHTLSSITTQTPIGGVLVSSLGSAQNLAGQQNELDPPAMGSMLTCYPELDTAVSASLQNTSATSVTSVTALPTTNAATALTLLGSC
jgi:hypothetical protein